MKKKKILLGLLAIILVISLAGCGIIKDSIGKIKGDLIGQNFLVSVFDSYGEKTIEMTGSKITIDVLEEKKKNDESLASNSSVLEITINGKQMIQVGNTMIFAEEGLDMIEDFQLEENINISKGGGIVPIDRYINNLKNKIGKEKTIVILSPLGTPIGVFEGKKVYVTVPDDLPKMTRLNIDGKSLYIHRANYMIFDTEIMN